MSHILSVLCEFVFICVCIVISICILFNLKLKFLKRMWYLIPARARHVFRVIARHNSFPPFSLFFFLQILYQVAEAYFCASNHGLETSEGRNVCKLLNPLTLFRQMMPPRRPTRSSLFDMHILIVLLLTNPHFSALPFSQPTLLLS